MHSFNKKAKVKQQYQSNTKFKNIDIQKDFIKKNTANNNPIRQQQIVSKMPPYIPKSSQKAGQHQTLDGLLFSSSHYDEEDSIQNQFHQNSKFIPDNLDLIQQKQQGFLLDNEDQYMNDDEDFKFQFPTVNAPSVQFSQNSMMMSKRYDEQSRIEKNRKGKDYQDRKACQAYQKQITELQYKIQKKQLEVQKLNGLIHGFQSKLKKKQQQNIELQQRINQLQQQKSKFQNQKSELYKRINSKDALFMEYKNQFKTYINDLAEKDELLRKQQLQIQQLNQHIQILKQNLHIYNDRDLVDFNPKSNTNQHKLQSSNYSIKEREDISFTRELDQIKKSLKVIEQENDILRNQISQKDQKLKLTEQSYAKKIQSKDKKLKQIEVKLNQSDDQLLKNRQKYEQSEKKNRDQLNKKLKQLKQVKQSQMELEKRLKNFMEQLHRKQERSRQLNIQIIEKNKQLNAIRKQLQQIKVRQQFQQHMIKQKQDQIEQLITNQQINRKKIHDYQSKQEMQKNGLNSLNRVEKQKQRQYQKAKKQMQKLKKQFQELKYEYDSLLKQNKEQDNIKTKQSQQKQHIIKDYKKKYQQSNKKLTQTKNKVSEMQNKNQQLQKIIQQLQNQLQGLNEEHQNVLKESQMLKNNCEQFKNECQQLKSESQQLKNQLQQLQKQNEELLKYKQNQEKNKLNLELSNKENKDKQFNSAKNKSLNVQLRKASQELKRMLEINKKIQQEKNEALNKLIILEAKFKQSLEHQNNSYNQEQQLKQKLEALQQLLMRKEDKIKEYQEKIKDFQTRFAQKNFDKKNMNQSIDYLSNNSDIHHPESLESQIYLREQHIEKLEQQINQKDQIINKLQEELQKKQSQLDFRQKSLQFLHKKILDVERVKMQIEAEKKMLQQSFYNSGHDSHEQEMKSNAFRKQIKSLQKQINIYKNKLLQKDELISKLQQQINNPENINQYKFEIRQLKKRLKQLSQLAMSKDRKLTPQSLSQQDTVQFLIKTIKRVPKSMDMIKILSKSQEFREGILRVDRTIDKYLKGMY